MNLKQLITVFLLGFYPTVSMAQDFDCHYPPDVPNNKWMLNIYEDEADLQSLHTTFVLVSTRGFHISNPFSSDPGAKDPIGSPAQPTPLAAVKNANSASSTKVPDQTDKVLYYDLSFDGSKYKNGPNDPEVLAIKNRVLASLRALPGISLSCYPLPGGGMGISN